MRPGRPLQRIGGFTLVELVTVIILLGIISVFAASRVFPDFTARQASEELIQALRHTQEAAMDHTGSAAAQLQIDADGIVFVNVSPGPTDWALLKPNPDLDVALSPTGTVGFNGKGRPQCGGGLSCAAGQAVITVSANGDSETVTLEAVTGFAHR